MSDIQKFTDCINAHLGHSVGIIRHKNWKMVDFEKELLSGSIILFDTSEVGFGEFGEKNKKEVKHKKWQNAIGIIQYKRNYNSYKKTRTKTKKCLIGANFW